MRLAWSVFILLGVFLVGCRSDIRQIDPERDSGNDADIDYDADVDYDGIPDGDGDIFECEEGFADCNNDQNDGCEINIASDVSNCGVCGNDCRNLPDVSAVYCNDGSCVIEECNAGYYDEDGDISNGCESTCAITFGAHEVFDDIDNDCDGLVDEDSDSLVFYASLDELSDGVVLDHSASENHGAVSGEVANAMESVFGGALVFDSRSYVEFENIDALNNLSEGTWMLWVQVSGEGVERLMMPLSKEGCYQFVWWPEGYYFRFGYGSATDIWPTYIGAEGALESGIWYFLAVTYDGMEFRFYVNGSLVQTGRSSGDISEFPTNLFIGADRRGSREFVGLIDEVAIYSRPWLQAEIEYYYNLLIP